jgi:hypothetical protein
MNLKRCERIANAGKGDDLSLHETHAESLQALNRRAARLVITHGAAQKMGPPLCV